MNQFAELFARWLADYYLLATMLLVVTLAVNWFISQPARRVALTRATLAGLALLAGLCALPGWSVVHLMTRDAEETPVAIARPSVSTEAVAIETIPVVAPIESAPMPAMPEIETIPAKTATEPPAVAQLRAVEIVGLTFLVGTLLVLAWQLMGHWRARVLLNGATAAPFELQQMLNDLRVPGVAAQRSPQVASLPRLLISPALTTAVALGILRPTILLPKKLIDTTNITDLRTILAHELAHIRHGDLRLLALFRAMFVLLWANPLFWLLRRRLRLDQETLADAAAAEVSTRHQYAEQLVDWAKRFATDRPPALAAAVGLWESPSQLRHRIAVLLDERLTIWRECSRRWRLVSLAVCAGVAVGLSLVTLEPGLAEPKERDEKPVANASKDKAAELAPAPTELSGIVHDYDGKPLAGVTVDAWTWYPGNETTTDENGRFSLKGFDALSEVEVEFRKAGFGPRHFVNTPAGIKNWTVQLDNRTYLEGQLTDPHGEPVANAVIRAERGPFENEHGVIGDVPTETTTKADGRYRLYLAPDTYAIKIRVPDRGVARYEGISIASDQQKPFDIQLEPGETFRAKIINSQTEEPVEGITLWNWRMKGIEGTSNADGVLEIPAMFPGKLEFNLTAVGDDRHRNRGIAGNYSRWWSEEAVHEHQRAEELDRNSFRRNFDNLDFDVSADAEPVTIYVEPCVTITGRVVDPDGNPVAGATVAPAKTGSGNSLTGDTRFSYETREDGTFEMKLPSSGAVEYNLIAHDGKYQEWRKWANATGESLITTPGERIEGIELQLTKPATVRGKVVNADGEPAAGKDVRAADFFKRDNRYYHPRTKSDGQGNFELKFIAPGKHYIQTEPFWLDAAEAPGGTVVVELEAGEVVENVLLESVEAQKGPILEFGVPMPPDKRPRLVVPEASSAKPQPNLVDGQRVEFPIVVAKNAMLLNGNEIITYPELEEKIAALPDPSLAFPRFYITNEASKLGLFDLTQNEMHRLNKRFQFKSLSIGSLLPRAGARYDKIIIEADLVPNPALKTEGRIFDLKGNPVAGAEVILVTPVDESIPYKAYDIAIVQGRIRNRLDEVIAVSDLEGRFIIYPPKDAPWSVIAIHPESGIAYRLDEHLTDKANIRLNPWAALVAEVGEEPKVGQSASISTHVRSADGHPEISFNQYWSDLPEQEPTNVFGFTHVPPIFETTVSRDFAEDQGGSIGISADSVALTPGESRRLDLGPLSDEQRKRLEDSRERWRQRREESERKRDLENGASAVPTLPPNPQLKIAAGPNGSESIGENIILCPITTDLQRSLLGNISQPATDASLCVFVNGMAFTDDQIDAGAPEFIQLADRLEEIAKTDNRKAMFRILIAPNSDEPFDKVRKRAETLSDLCVLLGRGAGFKRSTWSNTFYGNDFEWSKFIANARAAADRSTSDVEDSLGDTRVQVFPVRTYLSRLLVNADCVVDIVPVVGQDEGNRFPDDFVAEMKRIVPQLEYTGKKELLVRVRFTETAKDQLERWVNDIEGRKKFAEEFGFEFCNLSQSFTNEAEEAPKAANAEAQPNTISGRCVDEQGKPLADVKIELFRRIASTRKQKLMQETTTGADGSFHFDDVINIEAEFPQEGPSTSEFVGPFLVVGSKPGRTTFNISVSPGRMALAGQGGDYQLPLAAKLSGKVTGPDGQPLPDVRVSAAGNRPEGYFPDDRGYYSALTNERGEYEIDDLAPYDQSAKLSGLEARAREIESDLRITPPTAPAVVFRHPEFAFKRLRAESIPGKLDAQLRRGAVVEGRTVDQQGNPLAGAHVEIHANDLRIPSEDWFSAKLLSRDDGSFRIHSVPENTYRISGAADGLIAKAQNIRVQAAETVAVGDVTFEPGAKLLIQCIDAETKEPLKLETNAQATVVLTQDSRRGRTQASTISEVARDGTLSVVTNDGEWRVAVAFSSPTDGRWTPPKEESEIPVVTAVAGETVEVRIPVQSHVESKKSPGNSEADPEGKPSESEPENGDDTGSDFLRKIRESSAPLLAEMAEKHGYGLAPEVVLRRVPPPFPEVRMEYYRVGHPTQSDYIPAGPSAMSFRWVDGKLQNWGMTFGDPNSGCYTLSGVLGTVAGLKSQKISGPSKFLKTRIPGDWVVRPEQADEVIVHQLESILREELQLPIRLQFRDVEREIYVARGKYRYAPLLQEDATVEVQLTDERVTADRVHIFGKELVPGSGSGGGLGDLNEYFDWLGRWIDVPIVNEVAEQPRRQLSWELHERSPSTAQTRQEDHDPKLVLAHATMQTNLEFTKETRPIRTLVVEQSE